MGSAASKDQKPAGDKAVTATQSLLNKVEDGADKVKASAASASSSVPSQASSSSSSSTPAPADAKDDPLHPSVPSFLSGSRQSKLDAQIQSRIRSELDRLRKQEADVRAAIDAALEAENAAREKKAIDAGEGGLKGRSGPLLRKELEELRGRLGAVAERSKREIPGEKDIQKAREEVLACFKAHPDRSLDCWAEAQAFKEAVAKAEQAFVVSHSTPAPAAAKA